MQTCNRYTLETLLLIIPDRIIKSRIIARAVEKGISKDKHHIKQTIQLQSKLKLFSDAAKLAENSGLTQNAIELYYKAKLFDDVRRLDKQNGNNFKKVDFYYRIKSHKPITNLMEKKTNLKRTIYSYENDCYIQDTITALKEKNLKCPDQYTNFLQSLL